MEYGSIENICNKYGIEYKYSEPLSGYTTFNIGGCCDMLVKPDSAESIAEILKCCRKNNIKYYILGKGSNVLISDNGLKGLVMVISSSFSGVRLDGGDSIYCDSGASLCRVCSFARDNSLSGLEFAYGIPGSAGGALFMNAGAYGGEMKDVVEYCIYLNDDFEIRTMTADQMQLSYRHSIFSEKSFIILGIGFKLKRGNKQEISEKMSELMEKRRSKQPLEYPSAGSTFKRPEGDFAARLIEAAQLKGYTCGGAQVSEKHSGFVVNKGGAAFGDVINVINGVKERVYADSGVMLECEVLILE